MSLSNRLLSVKAGQLKQASFLMGLPSTGTKAELESIIRERLLSPSALRSNDRIVSVDMGIRNLGVCVLQTPSIFQESSFHSAKAKPAIKVLEWKRLDVLKHTTPPSNTSKASTILPEENEPASSQPKIDPAAFTPANLSRIAVRIAKDLAHLHDPRHILIERQRFRSGGAAAVQEWTLRVNMLESMLWAAFASMREQQSRLQGLPFPETFEVSPARVANFWCARPEGYETSVPEDLFVDGPKEARTQSGGSAAKGRRKVEKKEKIALVRSWLAEDARDPEEKVLLEFSDSARKVADGFLAGGRKRKDEKLDDLADCLLQGVAWIKWRENEHAVRQIFANEIEEEVRRTQQEWEKKG